MYKGQQGGSGIFHHCRHSQGALHHSKKPQARSEGPGLSGRCSIISGLLFLPSVFEATTSLCLMVGLAMNKSQSSVLERFPTPNFNKVEGGRGCGDQAEIGANEVVRIYGT